MSSEEESFDSLNRRKRKRITESVIDTDNEDGGECSQTKDEDGDINDDDIFVKRKRVSKSRLISSDEEEDAKACSEVSLESDEYSEGESGSSEADSSDASDDEDYVDEECDDETVIEDVDEAVDSDVSDGQSDKCPICLNKFRGQDTGTPESCDHVFCLDCIQVWARNVNTCPVDRQIFNLILVKDLGDKIIRRIPVAGKADDAEELAENDPTFCEVCGRGDREDRLLLCDACDLGYHCECLEPPIFDIPIEEWFCPDCAPNHDPNNVEVMDEVRNLVHNGFRPAPFNAPRRAIARTRASENVRSRIERLRMLALDGLTVGVDVPARPTATPARRNVTTRRRYKRTRRRRTTRRKKKTTTTTSKTKLSSTGKTKTVRRRRRKTKGRRKGKRTVRSRRAARPLLTTDSVKKRIANKLGLRRPPPGRTIPLVKSKSSGDRSIFGGRSEHGPALSIFGNREELIEFEDSYMSDDNQAGYGGGGSGDVLATVRLTSSHRASVNLKKAATILNQAKSNKST